MLAREEVVGVRGGDINNEEAARVTVVTSTGVLLGVPWNDSATVGYVPTPGKPTSVAGIGDVCSSAMGWWDHPSKGEEGRTTGGDPCVGASMSLLVPCCCHKRESDQVICCVRLAVGQCSDDIHRQCCSND